MAKDPLGPGDRDYGVGSEHCIESGVSDLGALVHALREGSSEAEGNSWSPQGSMSQPENPKDKSIRRWSRFVGGKFTHVATKGDEMSEFF